MAMQLGSGPAQTDMPCSHQEVKFDLVLFEFGWTWVGFWNPHRISVRIWASVTRIRISTQATPERIYWIIHCVSTLLFTIETSISYGKEKQSQKVGYPTQPKLQLPRKFTIQFKYIEVKFGQLVQVWVYGQAIGSGLSCANAKPAPPQLIPICTAMSSHVRPLNRWRFVQMIRA